MQALRSCLALSIAVALLGPEAARAQVSSPSPYSASVYNEGPGLRLGSSPLILNAGLAAEIGYDSNVFYLPSDEVGSTLMRLRAHLDLSTLTSKPIEGDHSTADPKLDFRFSAQAEYREYFSVDPAVRAQRSVNLLGGADVGILPRGPFTLRIVDTFIRTIDPRNEESPANFTRDYNRVGLIGSYHAGGLEVGLSDYFNVNYFESTDVSFGDLISDEGEAFARLRLLSQTLLSLSARFGYVHYEHNTSVDGTPLRVLAGASTLFTTWLGASVSAGYGNSLSFRAPSFNSAIGGVDVRFLLPRAARVTVGYRRDFYDTLLANAYSDDQLYVAAEQPFFSRIAVHLDGSVRFRNYVGLVDPATIGVAGFSSSTRSDEVFDAHAEFTVRAMSWLAISANYNLQVDLTDFELDSPGPVPVHYVKHSAFLRFDFAY